ncbi:hypothetical protein BKA81DRAFT_373587 [Phyllosticta paracitricarpa]
MPCLAQRSRGCGLRLLVILLCFPLVRRVSATRGHDFSMALSILPPWHPSRHRRALRWLSPLAFTEPFESENLMSSSADCLFVS